MIELSYVIEECAASCLRNHHEAASPKRLRNATSRPPAKRRINPAD
jgi:hypothetical protein